MALFRRNKEQDILPDEVNDYYKAEQRERRGMAWLIAGVGFLITVAIVVGLFFAGRWAFTTFFTDDTATDTSEIGESDVNDRTDFPPATEPTDETETDEDEEAAEQEQESDANTDNNQLNERPSGNSEELPRSGPIAE